MSVNPAITYTCLFRRVLSLINKVNIVSLQLVMSKLGVEQDTANALLHKLSGEGWLAEEGGQWVVQRVKFETVLLPKYLGRIRPSLATTNGDRGEGAKFEKDVTSEVLVKETRCSTVTKPYQVVVTGAKRNTKVPAIGGEGSTRILANGIGGSSRDSVHGGDVSTRRISKRRKVSAVKENLSI